MTNLQAMEILESLLDGFDPESDRPLTKESVFRQPRVMLALHNAIIALQKADDPRKPKHIPTQYERKIAKNRNKLWTITDDEILEMLYCDNAPLTHICEQLGRTPEGILSRMVRLGFIENRCDYPSTSQSRPATKTEWTYEDICQLETLVAEGLTTTQLAQKFCTTEKAIEARLFYMGLSAKAPDLHLNRSSPE